MARKPDVFVRAVSAEEGRKLAHIARRSKQPVRMRRAVVVMASAQRQPVGLIAKLMQVSEAYVRQVIHDFNAKGFDALDPKWSGGRPSKTDQAMRDRICRIARCCPRNLGWPFATWSLSKLVDVLRINGIVKISRETLRQILLAGGVSWQATKTWKGSNDPDFVAKMNRVLDLYDHPPADGRVVCVDEFGPLNLQPRSGRGWFTRRRPKRLRATYSRTHGVRHMFYFALNGTDHRSHAEQDTAIGDYIRWRNNTPNQSATSPSAPRSDGRITDPTSRPATPS